MDQKSTSMSSFLNYLFKKLAIKINTVTPYNHQSLQAEHGIMLLSTILMKDLTSLCQMWPKYLPLATFAHNTFNTPNLANYNPYEHTSIQDKAKHIINSRYNVQYRGMRYFQRLL